MLKVLKFHCHLRIFSYCFYLTKILFCCKDEGKPLMKEIEMDQYGGDVVDGLLPSSRLVPLVLLFENILILMVGWKN